MEHMRKSRLSQHKQGRLIEHFVAGTTARTAARLCKVHRNTAAYYFLRLRKTIAYELEAESKAMFDGEIEVDESYFGGRRKGKRGCGAADKIPVFGLLKRCGKVYNKIIPDASGTTLMPIIERKVVQDSIVYSNFWRRYNVLTCQTSITSVSSILRSSQTATITSMALRISGTSPSATCVNSTVFPGRILGYS